MKRFFSCITAALCLLAASCCGSLATAAVAEVPPRIAQWQESVCRIKADTTRFTDWGSGVYIGHGMILTANHTTQDTYASGGKFTVYFPGGLKSEAVFSGRSVPFDCAFLQITNSDLIRDLRPVLFTPEDPKVGDVIWRCGYGKAGRLEWSSGTVLGFSWPESAQASSDPPVWFVSTGGVSDGASGGPTFDDYGRLIGNLWGSANDATRACLATTITKTLTAPVRAQLVDFHRQCYGPNCYQTRPFMRPQWRPTKPQQRPTGRVVIERPKPTPPKKPLVPVVRPDKQYGELKAQIDRLEAMIAQCRSVRGPQGKQGPVGPPGPSEVPPAIDYDRLVDEVLLRLPPVRLEIRHPNGKRFYQAKPLGEAIVLELIPN